MIWSGDPNLVVAGHTYVTAGVFTVTVTVTDATGATTTASAETAQCTILGTNRAETLRGTDDDDVICGLGGNDRSLRRTGGPAPIGQQPAGDPEGGPPDPGSRIEELLPPADGLAVGLGGSLRGHVGVPGVGEERPPEPIVVASVHRFDGFISSAFIAPVQGVIPVGSLTARGWFRPARLPAAPRSGHRRARTAAGSHRP